MKGGLTARDGLIFAGVRNLKAYGYPNVSPQNILTDYVYRAFFVSMLKDNLGKGADREIKRLLAELGDNK